ncbi:MAG: DUF3375 family protein [Anaerolineales bacterium]|nr:DUF3375 family protein [Anaerolineales bacterium]
MNHDYLTRLRRTHPAWRLLAAGSAPLVAGFIHATFIEPNRRVIGERELVGELDDWLQGVRAEATEDPYPKRAIDYLNDWASDERAWLRRYYPPASDEAALRADAVRRAGGALARRPRGPWVCRRGIAPESRVRSAA